MWTQVLENGTQFLLLIIHQSCYSYILSKVSMGYLHIHLWINWF